jgi:hypothetical protein
MRGGAALGGGRSCVIDWARSLPKIGEVFLTGVIAPGVLLLGQWLYRRRQRPSLIISVERGAGFVEDRFVEWRRSPQDGGKVRSRYLRVRVTNYGRSVSKGVKIFITSFRRASNRSFFDQPSDPIPLKWAYMEKAEGIDIPPNLGFFADFVLLGEPWGPLEILVQSNADVPALTEALRSGEDVVLTLVAAFDDGLSEPTTPRLCTGRNMADFSWVFR